MERNNTNIVDVRYEQTGKATRTDSLGMREMQAKAYAHRNERFLLIKAPPASGKSRALMFIALDKLRNQGIKRVVVAVPEKSIGRSFQNIKLTKYGFFVDWQVAPYFDLCRSDRDSDTSESKRKRFHEFFTQNKAKILVCSHATLRNGMAGFADSHFDDCLLAIDEFHHTSASVDSGLGEVVRRVMNNSTGHIVAMTGSYFRGDGIPVLRAEDEQRFYPVTYTYYEQLNGYQYLKRLQLGYHFYHGNYLDHLDEVLDTHKKTIIHIPSVNSRASSGESKYTETEEIMKCIGTVERQDAYTRVYDVRTKDGRLLKVADLVEDDPRERDSIQEYLRKMKRKDDMDIIIALGTAKEGFDWQWCEECLTIGVRGSLTEVVQIIGRCTRDCEGKDTATFVNMIAMPDANVPDVKIAVNDFLKAITASLLMEQVMAPNWNFRTVKELEDQLDNQPRSIVVEGLKPLSSARTKVICTEQLDDLKAAVLQDPQIQRAITGNVNTETVTTTLIPKVIRNRYPECSDDEVEEIRQRLLLDWDIKAGAIAGEPEPDNDHDNSTDDDVESDGNRLLKLNKQFINIDNLSINLIDKVNPFRRAYEILSKSVDAPTLKIIQDTIAEQKYDMTTEEAISLFPSVKEFTASHGRRPDIKSPNQKEKMLAIAFLKLRNLKIRHDSGLEYKPD